MSRIVETSPTFVTVSAPAGFGKTTLLSEWVAAERRPVVWIGLDVADDDPAVLISRIATGFAALSPVAARLAAAGPGAGTSLLRRGIPLLADALQSVDTPYLFVIDDIHMIEDERCWDLLNLLTDAVPRGSTLVVAGRLRPVRLARGRMARAAIDVTEDDLRMDARGAQAIADLVGVSVGEEELQNWVSACEGWAAGIHMCAMLERDRPWSFQVPDTGRLLADYLYDQCLGALPPQTREFLLACSISEMLVPSLCAELAGCDATAAAEILDELETRQLFTTRVDGDHSYRLHGLFREYLQRELRRRAPDRNAELHRRAADWFILNAEPIRAIEHLLLARERERAAALVTSVALDVYRSGQVGTLERWIAAIGDRTLAASPGGAIVTTWVEILHGDVVRAEHWARLVEALPDADTSAEGWSFTAGRAMIRAAMLRRGLDAAVADAELAVALEPATSPWRDMGLQILGTMYAIAGRTEDARLMLRDAIAVATAFGNPDSVLISETDLALLAARDGDLDAASAHAHRAVQVVEAHNMQGYGTSGQAAAALAAIAARRGEGESGARELATAMASRVHNTAALPSIAIRTRLLMAECYLDRNDVATAAMLLGEVAELRHFAPGLGVIDEEIAQLEERCRQAVPAEPGNSGARPNPATLTEAELRLLPLLQTHLTRAEIAARLFVSPNTAGTQIASIFRKLGVSSRSHAVRRAHEIGLIDGAGTPQAAIAGGTSRNRAGRAPGEAALRANR